MEKETLKEQEELLVDQELPAEDGAEEEVQQAEEVVEPPTPLEVAEIALAELSDKHLRLKAEYDNFRKRSIREKDGIYPEAVASTVTKMLPVVDNFARAMACETTDEQYKKGVEMTYQSLLATLEALGVKAFAEKGEAFDPNIHNGIMTVEDETLEKDTIAEVFQQGYKLGERILRPAMVKVVS